MWLCVVACSVALFAALRTYARVQCMLGGLLLHLGCSYFRCANAARVCCLEELLFAISRWLCLGRVTLAMHMS